MNRYVTLCPVPIDPRAPEYVYRQLAAILRARIADGEFYADPRFPSLRELEQQYQVAPMTIRKAVKVLVDEGLLVTYPGRGTFVA